MSTFAPLMAVLQIAMSVEAFQWFSRSLPRFRKIGYWALAVIALLSATLTRLFVPHAPTLDGALKDLPALESGVGTGLGMMLLVALIGFYRFRHLVPSSANWHAFCLAILSIGNAAGWLMLSRRTIAGSVIGSFALWLLTVKNSPTAMEAEPRSSSSLDMDAEMDAIERDIARGPA